MRENTYEFIESMNDIMRTNTINMKNMVVFDETVLGDSLTLPLYIGARKDSGGGSTNVCRTRQKRLGSYIPFSLPDGSTPFRVFIVRDEEMKKGDGITVTLAPGWEKGLQGDPHRLFLKSETGFLNKDIFAYIMDEFGKWWTVRNPGLHCFLICDNLSIHRSETIVKDRVELWYPYDLYHVWIFSLVPGTRSTPIRNSEKRNGQHEKSKSAPDLP